MGQILGFGKLALAATLVAVAAAAHADSPVTVVVPGQANPWLAGLPDGATASFTDVAPGQSPVLVPGLALVAGTVVQFLNVTGGTLNMDGCPGVCIGAEGDPSLYGYTVRADFAGYPDGENGIGNVLAPFGALLGVYLGADLPTSTAAPATMDFQSTATGLNFTTLSPGLKQVFFIGNGMTDSGVLQSFAVPTGATRLYLGTLDGFGWSNNTGELALDVSAVPEPATGWMALIGLAGLATALTRRR